MNKTINIKVLAIVDSLKELSKKIFKKVFYYLGIGAFTTFFLVVGVSTTAQAVDLAADDIWADGIASQDGTITDPSDDMDVDLREFQLQFLTAGDGQAVGAITDTSGSGDGAASIDVLNVNSGGAMTQTIGSVIVGGSMIVRNIVTEDNITVTVSSTSVANVIGGVLQLTNNDSAADADIIMDVNSSLEVTGIVTLQAHTGAAAADTTLMVDKAATFTAGVVLDDNTGLSYLKFNENNAVTIAGTIQGAADGEGTLVAVGTGKTFSGVIGGSSKKLLEVQVDGASATFSAAVTATTVDVNAATTFSSTSSATNMTVDADTTFTGVVTASTAFTVDTSAAVTLSAASDLSLGTVTTGTLTSDALLTTSDLINTAGKVYLNVKDNEMGAGRFAAGDGSELHIGKAFVTTDNIYSSDDANGGATDWHSGSKTYLPSNLTSGETLTITDAGEWDATSGDAVTTAAAIDVTLQDTALVTYAASAAAVDSTAITITATDRTVTAVSTQLGATKNVSTALLQAMVSMDANDTTGDTAYYTAFDNAMKAQGGLSATADTDLALQTAPQTDGIAGSTLATRAMTGTVQGIVSNRMASLRSGDAYVTGITAGDSMSSNSGFFQIFGTDVTQKNTKVGSGTEFGYDADTLGIALGFDGITEDGSIVGFSFSRSDTDVAGKGTGKSKNDIESYTASIYADKVTENGYLEGSLTIGINDNATSRIVNTAGLDRTYKGSYDSEHVSLKIGGGVPNQMNNGAFITPFGSLTGTLIQTDSYTETSTTASDALRLTVAQDDISSIVGSVGFKAHKVNDEGGTPMISLAINNEFGDNTINNTNTYTGGGSSFKTSTNVEELSATLGLGFSFSSDGTSFNIGYEAEANEDDYLSHYGTLKFVHKF